MKQGGLLIIFFLFINLHALAQRPVSCPENIGFELGTLKNWECFAGKVSATGAVNASPSSPLSNRHSLLQNTYPQQKDQ